MISSTSHTQVRDLPMPDDVINSLKRLCFRSYPFVSRGIYSTYMQMKFMSWYTLVVQYEWLRNKAHYFNNDWVAGSGSKADSAFHSFHSFTLGTYWLKVKWLLVVALLPWDSWTTSTARGHKVFFLNFFFESCCGIDFI